MNKTGTFLQKTVFFVLALAITVTLLMSWAGKKPLLKNGIWRCTLQRPDARQIVFNFETKDSAGKKIIYVINAEERLLVDDVQFVEDSVFIQMPFFDSGFRAKINKGGSLEGKWIKKNGERQIVLPFRAVYNEKNRFPVDGAAAFNISGKWAAHFKDKNNSVEEAVGVFKQQGNRVTGTFLHPAGDYRYLEGVVSGDSLKLSAFDGSHAFLFTAKIDNDYTISGGVFYAGATDEETWTAEKNNKASIPDGYSITRIKAGVARLQFSFINLEGKTISLTDSIYKDKVVVIQALGSWCPNCMDETRFLSDYYLHNRQRGVEIIGLAYERFAEADKAGKTLQSFMQRLHVPYQVVLSGVAVSDPLRSEKTLPQIDKIHAFPTTLFIDKKGNIRKVYSGFSGPGTGDEYPKYKNEFNNTINALLAE